MASDNKSLGKFHLVGLPTAPRGVPQIEVSFDIDANGILNVSAKDRGTGKEQKITITSSSGLAEEEIKTMVDEGEAHVEEDRRKREEIEARNRADNLVYNTEKILTENRDKISDDDAKAIEDAVADTKKAMEGDDVEAINKAVENLTQSSHRLAEVMYQSTQQEGQEPPPGDPQSTAGGAEQGQPDDEVIDAEYVDVDDKK
jgi:molecular chaperone DnaK